MFCAGAGSGRPRRTWHRLSAGGYGTGTDAEESEDPEPWHGPVVTSLRTVGWWLARLGLSRLRDVAPDGEGQRRSPGRIRVYWPGRMVHLEVKEVGKIPDDGWRAHGREIIAAKNGLL